MTTLSFVLYSMNLFAACVVIGRITKGLFTVKPAVEKWVTHPDLPVPLFGAALSTAIQQDLDRMYAKEQREAREIATGIVIDPGGTCLCKRCGRTVSAMYDHCDNCNNKLDWRC